MGPYEIEILLWDEFRFLEVQDEAQVLTQIHQKASLFYPHQESWHLSQPIVRIEEQLDPPQMGDDLDFAHNLSK